MNKTHSEKTHTHTQNTAKKHEQNTQRETHTPSTAKKYTQRTNTHTKNTAKIHTHTHTHETHSGKYKIEGENQKREIDN